MESARHSLVVTDRHARWTHLEDAPQGEKLTDRFAAYWKPLQEFGAEGLDMSIIDVDPGERGPYHSHEGSVEEYYLVLDGNLDVELDDETVQGRPGTVLYFPPGAPHRPVNRSDETARFLSMRTGEGGRTVLSE